MYVNNPKEKFQQIQLSVWGNRIYINILTINETRKNRYQDVRYFNF